MELSSITYRLPFARVTVEASETMLRSPNVLSFIMEKVMQEQATAAPNNLYGQVEMLKKKVRELEIGNRKVNALQKKLEYTEKRYERLKRKYFRRYYKGRAVPASSENFISNVPLQAPPSWVIDSRQTSSDTVDGVQRYPQGVRELLRNEHLIRPHTGNPSDEDIRTTFGDQRDSIRQTRPKW